MLCESCGESIASVELKLDGDGMMRKIHLCERCAMEKGIDVPDLMSVTDILAGLNAFGKTPAELSSKSCPACGLSLKDLKKGSRLGCGACYEAFEPELQPILAGIHGSSRHVGKKPRARGEQDGKSDAVNTEVLERRLESAVSAENYEEAARLRDVLHSEGSDREDSV
jgi:protein arginine kinase activator